MDELLQEFIAETRETLEALSGEIVAWEADPADRARLDAIFRFVHTVKGSCGFLDLPRLGRLSHAAEDVLAAVRAGERVPDARLVNAVLAIVDRIGELVEAIDAGVSLDDSGEELLILALAGGTDTVAPSSSTQQIRAPSRSVRLSVDLLDRMMSGMSDMVLARNELARRLREAAIDPSIEAALERMSLTVAELRDTVTRTRMQKIEALFSALPRMVRDTAAGLGKSVALAIDGSDVELDREMIEMLRDPLVHIVRNAIDHGIEAPAERRQLGKRENGRLTVSARQSGNQIIVEIADDGRGIDTEKLIAKLAKAGRNEAELRALAEPAKLALIFEPGLTTKDEVSDVSGRGVGMDVVKANIEQIGGRIDLHSTPGRGLHIAISVPLTLSIITTIGVRAGSQRFAVPRQAIEEIVSTTGDAIRVDTLGARNVATVRGRRLPLVSLNALLGVASAVPEAAMLAIVSIAGGSYALAVDSVLDTEELVVKPAAPAVMATGLYAGQTLPDSGLPMLLLDCAGVAAVAGLHFGHQEEAESEPVEEVQATTPALLFTDLDGVRRAVALAIVDRVETVPADAIRFTAGSARLTLNDRIIPLVLSEAPRRSQIGVLRLRDDVSEIGYGIAEALDIVGLPDALVPARSPGAVAGVVALDGDQVEVLDPFWLFAQHADPPERPEAPLCLLADDASGWMKSFLRPALEAAGYRVATAPAPGETPAVVLTAEGAAPPVADVPVIQLSARRDAGGEAIFRYDRETLLAALKQHAGGRP